MKSLILCTLALLISIPALASTNVTCQLKTQIKEDGADRPIMEVLASDTRSVTSANTITLRGTDVEGTSSFELSVFDGEVEIEIRDIQNNRKMYSRVYGVDLNKPKFKAISFLNPENFQTKSRELVLHCFGN